MRMQRQKAIRKLCLNPTADNPWDQIKFKFWKDSRITNICLGASQAALQTYEDSANIKYIFSASEKPLTAGVQRMEQRNVQGLILFNSMIVDSPWETSSSQNKDMIKLLEEKAPLIMALQPSTNVLNSHEMQIQHNAQKSVESMKSLLQLLLARTQKFTSHTFHVFLRELITGAKVGRSLLFTRIV
jgi:hypothetical protein